MKKTVIDLSNIPFGRRLALLRGLKEKKQQEVADELKLSSKNLSKWENSECEPSLIDLKQLSDYYAVSLDFIIKGIANDKDLDIPICSIGIVKKKKRRNRFGYAVLRYNYLVLKSFNYLSSFSVILFRTLQSKPFSEFIG